MRKIYIYIYVASNVLTANSSQLESIKFIYGCRSKQYITIISKNISIKLHFPFNKDLYGRNIEHKLFVSLWFTICYYFSRFLYMYNISHVSEQRHTCR